MSHVIIEDLPEMCQTTLDEARLRKLFSDLQHCARIHAIIAKTGPGYVCPQPQSISLDEALALLIDKKARGVQIRYEFQQSCWIDTLIHMSDGVQLTRVQHPSF